MYLEHFGLTDAPFRLTPDLAYRFEDGSQAGARTMVRIALEQGAGFIKVTGEVGLGKTLLCRRLLADLQDPFVTAWLPDPELSPGALRCELARDLGLDLPGQLSRRSLHELLQSRLLELARAGKRPVLLIDESQALPASTLETVRLLTNLETEQRKLLQVVLFGQPELDQRLASPQFRQLRQRIVYACRLQPLDRADVDRYLRHRLAAAGSKLPLFRRSAVTRIARASAGTPRLINILADKALLAAYGRGRSRVGASEVRRAIADTEATRDALWWPKLQPTARLAAFSLVAFGVFLALEAWLGGLS